MEDIVKDAILDFDFWDFGLDEVDDSKWHKGRPSDWVNSLAANIVSELRENGVGFAPTAS